MKIKTLLIASLLFMLWAGNVKAQNSSASLPHTQDFETESEDPWTYIPGSSWSEIQEEIADENNHIFHFSGSSTDSYLISPELDGTQNGLRFQFVYTNYFLEPEPSRFRVGYSTFTADLEDFVWGETITAVNGDYEEETGDGDWATFVSDFPEGVRYIAISVLSNSVANFNFYVDDLSITETSETSCALPAMFQVTATTSNSISLGWQGNNDSYDVQYAASLFFDFEEGEDALDNEEEDNGWKSYGDGYWGMWLCDRGVIGHNESDFCPYSDLDGFEGDNYLVSPRVYLGGSISFYAKYESLEGGDPYKGNRDDVYYNTKFQVLVYLGDNLDDFDPEECEIISDTIKAVDSDWPIYSFSLEDYDGEEGYVVIRHINDAQASKDEYNCLLLIDDVTILAWESFNTEDSNYTISDLDPETEYAVRMRGNKGEAHSSWTDVLNVKTFPTTAPSSYTFTTAGDWNKPSNWANMYIPQQVTDNVTINAAAIVPEGCVAKGSIAIGNNGSITIRDGGQLYTEDVVEATIKKRINRYTIEGDPDQLADGWHFISYPLNCDYTAGGDDPNEVTNMITTSSAYDLYHFDSGEDLEWRNYKDEENSLKLLTGHGYLYANEKDVTLKFNGSLNYRDPDADFVSLEEGWNLVGNPFAYNTYPSMPYYMMNAEGTAIEATEYTTANAVAPCTGILVYNNGDNGITFSKDAPNTTNGNLSFAVAKLATKHAASSVSDKAIVSFNEGCQLEKYYFGKQSANLYIPQGNKEYAITYSNKQGEMPLNFVSKENGTYMLTTTIEGEEMSYLHLIDNLTGADIDLLQEPEYTFEARTTDYASRFRVVFAANEVDASSDAETFAFNSNGTWIVVNEGQATLQVVDMTGRLLSSETIDGSAAIGVNQPAGIYMFRLINGNDVKVQKVVVR